MPNAFQGRWRLQVTAKNAAFEHRLRVAGASSGNGTFPGVAGTQVEVDGPAWTVTLEWNNGVGSGWQESGVLRTVGSSSPLVLVHFLNADDNFPAQRDNDYDDLVVRCTDLDPVFDVVQRPFALDRGTLTMLPDGVFDSSQGVQYMGVRIRNSWDYGWDDWTGMGIGVAPSSRTELASQGIQLLDSWTAAEQRALQQTVTGGFVKVPSLPVGGETIVYFKLDVRNASPGKPAVKFVAQRTAWDPAYDALSRQVPRPIFISRSTYNPANRELVAELPEGTAYMRLSKIVVDRASLKAAIRYAMAHPCTREPVRPGKRGGHSGRDRDRVREELREALRDLLAGKKVDPCLIWDLLDDCERPPCECDEDGKDDGDKGPGEGGLGEGPGADNWCRFKPFHWLPLEVEYRIVPNPSYTGQYGPLAFEDPWWKVVLIILAVLLAIASLIYDYIYAGQDPNFVIGTIRSKSGRTTSNVDAAVVTLNGSRGVDLNAWDAQGDDRNNGLPIDGGTGGTAAIDRSDNGDRGIEDAVLGNLVFKSGARSGTTRGTVVTISLNVPVDGISYTNQVGIAPLAAPDDQPISQAGDSGSLWIDMTSRRPIALNFAGPATDDGSGAIANPIRDVVTLFDLHFNG